MTIQELQLNDPVPWFDASTLADTQHNLGVMAGRWIALYFFNPQTDILATRLLAEIIVAMGRSFSDDHCVFYAVMSAPPHEGADLFKQASHRGLGFIKDYNKSISKSFGALATPRLVLIDPQLRLNKVVNLIGNIIDANALLNVLANLPSVDEFAEVPLMAPALIIPKVFEKDFCQHLINLFETYGGVDSGVIRDKDGQSTTIIDYKEKRRTDFHVEDEEVRKQIRDRVVRRVVPMMDRFLSYKPTRMDRYLVSCYDASTGGYFSRHRDNINAGAAHRRFAASFNLNDGFEGCELIFPEFGRRLYRPPVGGAIVFSTGILHQVMPIKRGRRYAYIPFFYGEEEALLRKANNAKLLQEDRAYVGDRDKLYPDNEV